MRFVCSFDFDVFPVFSDSENIEQEVTEYEYWIGDQTIDEYLSANGVDRTACDEFSDLVEKYALETRPRDVWMEKVQGYKQVMRKHEGGK